MIEALVRMYFAAGLFCAGYVWHGLEDTDAREWRHRSRAGYLAMFGLFLSITLVIGPACFAWAWLFERNQEDKHA